MVKPNHIIFGIAIVKFLVSFVMIHPVYELHRDEYLYLAESDHLAWGYLEAPPLLSVLGYLSKLFGNSIGAVRFWGALFGAMNIVLIGKMVQSLGGKTYACLLACLAFFVGAYLRMNILFQPNFLEVFFWTLCLYCIIQVIQTNEHKNLYLLAIALAFAFYSKYTMVFLFAGFIMAFFLTPLRKWFLNRHLYFAGLLFLLLTAPNLYWQIAHNFPVMTHMKLLNELLLVHVSRKQFLIEQLLFNIPALFVWISGLIYIFTETIGKKYRAIVIIYFTTIAGLMFFNGKGYYSMGLYPTLFAFGGIALEKWTANTKSINRIFRLSMPAMMLLLLIPIFPALIPIDIPQNLEKNYRSTGMDKTGILKWENNDIHAIPQDFADMLGWKEMAEKTARAYKQLPEEIRKETIIFADNYGQAGALNFYRKGLGLPEIFSDNASFLYWLPTRFPYRHVLLLDFKPRDSTDMVFKHFESPIILDSLTNEYAREKGILIMLYKNGDDSVQTVATEAIRAQKAKYQMQ
jgi:hypothetical protein